MRTYFNIQRYISKVESNKFHNTLNLVTFLYRSKSIRWRFVLVCAIEFIICVVTTAVVLDLYVVRPFEELGEKPVSQSYLIFSVFRCNFAGVFVMMYFFYMALHAFQNLFAELTRFADREFYQVMNIFYLENFK